MKALFTFLPAIYAIPIVLALSNLIADSREAWSMVAVACGGMFYLHHAFSRADLSHLAQSIAPLIILMAVFCAQFSFGWLILCLFSTISAGYLLPQRESWMKQLFNGSKLVRFTAGETSLWLPPNQAGYLQRIHDLLEQHTTRGETALLLPNLVTLYPLFQRKAVVYDIFSVYPATEEEDTRMVEELSTRGVRFALINNHRLDARDDLRFCNTHPAVWQHLQREFDFVGKDEQLPDHYLFLRNS